VEFTPCGAELRLCDEMKFLNLGLIGFVEL
jgi:hypothetical protein